MLNFSALPRYLRGDARSDAIAGLTVTVMGVPQAMAYAMIADLPPVYGLYTAMVTCAVAALFTSSSHLVTGPTNALCMVLLSLTTHLQAKYSYDPFEIVLLLTFLIGLLQLTFGLLRMGGILRYVSNSVVVGFTAGAGILIIANQLKNLLGVDLAGERPQRFHEVLETTLRQLPETNPYTLGIGLMTALAVVFLPKIDRRIPAGLIGTVLAGLVTWYLGWYDPAMGAHKVDIVRDIQPISGNLGSMFRIPSLIQKPDLELARDLGTGAMALAILGLIESGSISRAIASSSGQRLDFNRMFRAQGLGNIAGSFFSCFAGSGSFTRSAVNFKAGGRTRMAAIFSALFTALTVVLLAPFANFIPKAALAGLLMVVAYNMVEKHRLKLAFVSTSQSRVVLFGTLAATLILPLEYAIFTGVMLSIVMLLRMTAEPDLTQIVPNPDSGFDEVPFNRAAPSEVVTVNLEGDFHFAAVENLEYELLRCLTPKTRVVVLRMKRLRAVGSTAMAILEHFWKILLDKKIHLVVSGIEDKLKDVMTNSGLRRSIGEQNLFYADNKLFQSTELAHARAWSIVRAEKRRTEVGEKKGPSTENLSVTATDLMSPRCIRFGNEHQLREAMWLMSEMQKHMESSTVQPLFLQDREGKLAGELTIWRQMEQLVKKIDPADLNGITDQELGERFRSQLTLSINKMAHTDLDRLGVETTLAELLFASVDNDLSVIPICDADGRIIGLVDQVDLLAGVGLALGITPVREASGAPAAPGAKDG